MSKDDDALARYDIAREKRLRRWAWSGISILAGLLAASMVMAIWP